MISNSYTLNASIYEIFGKKITLKFSYISLLREQLS